LTEESDSDSPARPGGYPDPSALVALERKIRDLAKPRPIYTPKSVHPAHALRYDWTGWLADNTPFPPDTRDVIRQAAPLWEADGLHLGELRVNADRVQILFTASPKISPVLCTSRVKGRLQHALRQAGSPVTFTRKTSFRSLGDNVSPAVEGYLAKQVSKEQFVDPRFVKHMQEFIVQRDEIDLALPTETASGRYWYNIHLVLVIGGRMRMRDDQMMRTIRDSAIAIARRKGYGLKALSLMPDHLHVAFRGNIEQSPEEIALAFLNNLAYLVGRKRIWQDGYYVGTFSEYDMKIVRRLAQ
jgi:REP element-mobilizing transposase RayT